MRVPITNAYAISYYPKKKPELITQVGQVEKKNNTKDKPKGQ